MYYVYIIQSIKFPSKSYIGFSEDLRSRLQKHNYGSSSFTSKFKPWKLIFCCAFNNKKKALDFEKYLKTSSGTAFKRKRLV